MGFHMQSKNRGGWVACSHNISATLYFKQMDNLDTKTSVSPIEDPSVGPSSVCLVASS